MKATVSLKAAIMLIVCVISGFFAGFSNGLIGTGAGIVFMLLFRIIGGEISKDTFAFSMACVIPLSAFSLFTYRPPENFSLQTLITVFIIAVAGGLFGALLQRNLKIGLLKKIFAALVIYSGINMLLK